MLYSKLYKLTMVYEIQFYDSVTYGGGNPFSIFSNGILSMGYTVIQIIYELFRSYLNPVREYFKTSIYQM